jgi:DNA-binding response OmpR family regulator
VDVTTTAAAAHTQLSLAYYRLVIADWMLPDGDGIYIADRVVDLGSRTLIITGHLSDLPPGTAARHQLLRKPVNPAELLALVRALIGEPSPQPVSPTLRAQYDSSRRVTTVSGRIAAAIKSLIRSSFATTR